MEGTLVQRLGVKDGGRNSRADVSMRIEKQSLQAVEVDVSNFGGRRKGNVVAIGSLVVAFAVGTVFGAGGGNLLSV